MAGYKVMTIALHAIKCRFGCSHRVVGLYWMPKGCVCWPDQVQALCAQHAVSAEPIGDMTLMYGPGPWTSAGDQSP